MGSLTVMVPKMQQYAYGYYNVYCGFAECLANWWKKFATFSNLCRQIFYFESLTNPHQLSVKPSLANDKSILSFYTFQKIEIFSDRQKKCLMCRQGN